MTPLNDLPAEQRAVLELVLRRGRSYDEIAGLLSIDRARVRQRALSGFDALGPGTSVAPERRALITDYLLGQLPERVAEQVAQRLAREPGERAWARVIASELVPVAAKPLPVIPTAAELEDYDEGAPEDDAADAWAGEHAPGTHPAPPAERSYGDDQPPSSRRGGAILLAGGGLLVIVIVVVIIALSSGSSSKTPPTTASSTPSAGTSTPASTPTGASTGTTGTTPRSLATVKLSPSAAGSKAQGVAEAFVQTSKIYLALVAINLAANSHNFYAVWLSNSPSDSRLIGFSPAVTSNGRLQAAGTLTASDGRYKQLLLTLETTAHPKVPGTTVLSGAFSMRSP